jgi:hypothetical protein
MYRKEKSMKIKLGSMVCAKGYIKNRIPQSGIVIEFCGPKIIKVWWSAYNKTSHVLVEDMAVVA